MTVTIYIYIKRSSSGLSGVITVLDVAPFVTLSGRPGPCRLLLLLLLLEEGGGGRFGGCWGCFSGDEDTEEDVEFAGSSWMMSAIEGGRTLHAAS